MIIKTENLTKHYQKVTSSGLLHKKTKTVQAVQNVSLQVEQGQRVGLVGLNGSGKSTLIKLILGILQPSSGNVATFGVEPITHRQQNARKIGVVFGQRSQLRWDLPAMDTFKLNREIYQVAQSDFQARLAKLTRMLAAEDFLTQPVRTLSLGQRMKAEFIAALLHDPELLILDEPTIGLDTLSKNSIVQFLKSLTSKTIIFTSHDLDEVEQVCSRIMIMNQGHLVLDQNSSELVKFAVPSTITFTSKQVSYDELKGSWPNVRQLVNGDFEIAQIRPEQVKDILSKLTATVPIENITVKNNRLEYLLAHISGGKAHEI